MSTDAAEIAREAAPIGHGKLQWRILIGFVAGLVGGLLAYTVVVSSIAVAISLAAVNLLRPGDGVDPAAARELLAQGGEGAASIVAASAESEAGVNAFVAIVPNNVVAAMSNNDILAVMFFALFFGIGLLLVQTPRTAILKDAVEAVTGITPELSTSGGTSDARFLQDLCPVIDFGPPNATMHKRDEAVALDDLEALERIYRRIALAALTGEQS